MGTDWKPARDDSDGRSTWERLYRLKSGADMQEHRRRRQGLKGTQPQEHTRMRIAIADITVGDRRRQALGDINALARSLKRYGQLHPIGVTADRHLIWGKRRLEAAKRLGWTHIEATDFGPQSEAEQRELELEENEQRKDLTAEERSRRLVRRAVIAGAVLAAQNRNQPDNGVSSDSEETPKHPGGRPRKGQVPIKDVADYVGVSLGSLSAAQTHVAVVDRHPELSAASQDEALAVASALKKYPALEEADVPLQQTPVLAAELDVLSDEQRAARLAAIVQNGAAPAPTANGTQTDTSAPTRPPKEAPPAVLKRWLAGLAAAQNWSRATTKSGAGAVTKWWVDATCAAYVGQVRGLAAELLAMADALEQAKREG
jgi:ParB family chromosome partitioning protein